MRATTPSEADTAVLDCRVEAVTRLADARSHIDAWRRLHRRRADDNVFLCPDLLLPMLEHVAAETPWSLVFVYDGDDEMIATAIFGEPARDEPLPHVVLPTWENPFFLDATPILVRDRTGEAARALLGWLDEGSRDFSTVRWSRIRLDSVAWRAIVEAADDRDRRWWLRRSYDRAVLRPRESFEEYLAEMPSRRRGRMRNRLNRLQREGQVRVRIIRQQQEDPDMIDRFLKLEAAGWKGEAGTALACDIATTAFFRDAVSALSARRAIQFLEVSIDGRAAGINVDFLDGGRLFGFKSAYEPELDSLSPGICTDLEVARSLHEDPEIEVLDSCAQAGSHLDPIWYDSVPIGEVLMATGMFAGLTISALPYLRRTRDLARRAGDRLKSA